MFKIATIFKRGKRFYALILFEDAVEPIYFYLHDTDPILIEAALSLNVVNLVVVTHNHFRAEIEYIRNHIKMFKQAPTTRLDILEEDKSFINWMNENGSL